MYPADFDYYRARSVAEAHDLLKKYPGAKFLAGGHSLIPLLKLRLAAPPAIIDIGHIAELKGIAIKDGLVRIGALTTHAELAASPVVREQCPALAEAAAQIGDPAVRNRGTIGGNVAHADPASDLPTVLTALGARFTATGARGSRAIEVDAFFKGTMVTALDEQDLLTVIEVPVKAVGQGMTYVKFEHPASRYAVLGVAVSVTAAAGNCTAAAVALGGLVPRPRRSSSVERALLGQPLTAEVFSRAAAQVANDLGSEILGDLYASAEYRKAMAPVFVKRALSDVAERVRVAAATV